MHLLHSPSGGFPGLRPEDAVDAEESGASADKDNAHAGGQSSQSATSGPADNPGVELDALLQENVSGGNEGSPFCDVDGKQVHKQRVLTEFMGSQFGSASRDRLKRVRGPTVRPSGDPGWPGVGGGVDQGAGIGNTDARGLCVGDPFAIMVMTRPGHYALGLFSCTAAPSEETRAGDEEVVKGRLMRLKRTGSALEAGERDGTSGVSPATSSAPLAHSWDHWGGLGMHKGELSCKSRIVLPLNPDVVQDPVVVKETVTSTVLSTEPTLQESAEVEIVVHRTSFRFSLDDLVAVHKLLVEEVGALKAWRHVPVQKIARADANPLPIHEDLFHVEADTMGATPVGGRVRRKSGASCAFPNFNDRK